jgi:peptide/nickel transport system substrate-binding protein
MSGSRLQNLVERYQRGQLSRRAFLNGAMALGLSATTAMLLAGCDDPDDLDTTTDTDDEDVAADEPDDDATDTETEDEEEEEVETDDEEVDEPDDDEMVINLGVAEEPPDLEPHNLTAAAAGLIGFVVMPGLVWLDFDLGLSPMLAEDWDSDEDGLVWTFTLRDNLVFHNGKPCDAHEVVRNFEHILDPESGSMLTPDFELVESVEAVDDLTVEFTLSEPFAPFLAVLSHRCAITDMDEYDTTTPIGTGPFRIVSWDRGSQVTLERHDEYWEDDLPHASRVNWRFLPDADVRLTAMRAEEIDITSSVPDHMLEELMSADDFEVDPISGLTHQYLAFNCSEGHFADVRMRKAVAHAIDKEAILEAALWGNGLISNIPHPPDSPWYVEIPDYERDLDRARELMEEAGYGDGFSLDMPIPDWTPSSEVAEIVQADLAEIGIDLRIVQTEWATYWPDIYLQSDFEITFMGYSARVDPDQTFYPRYHSEGVHNATIYANDELDELLERGRVTIDEDERKEIYDRVQEILVDELPWLWLYIPNVTMGWAHYIEGFQQHPAAHVYLKEVRVPS